MNDSVLIWEKYTSLHEANLISKDPLHLELEKILKEKNVQKPEIVNWFLKTYEKNLKAGLYKLNKIYLNILNDLWPL